MVRIIIALCTFVLLSMVVAFALWMNAFQNDFATELFSAAVQIGVVAVAGAIISLLLFNYRKDRDAADKERDQARAEAQKERDLQLQKAEKERERERLEREKARDLMRQQGEKEQELERKRLEYREQLLKETLQSAMQSYSKVKKARRMLRAKAIQRIGEETKDVVTLDAYDTYMEMINDAQLELENIARDVENSAPAFSEPGKLKKYLWTMEAYINKIVKEYERRRKNFQGNPSQLDLASLPKLNVFLDSSEKGFKPGLAAPLTIRFKKRYAKTCFILNFKGSNTKMD